MLVPFQNLPDDARLWVFASERPLSSDEVAALRQDLASFLTDWKAHGAAVEAGFEIQDDHFVLIASTNAMADPSGCSIDAMTRFVREHGQKIGVNFMPGGRVYFRQGDKVNVADRPSFKALALTGAVNAETRVFDTMLTSVAAYRESWEAPAGSTWHASMLPVATSAS